MAENKGRNGAQDENLDEEEIGDELIELVDEEGKTQTFELLASFALNDSQYLAVTEPTEEEDPESMEVFILRIDQDEEGNDIYVSVDDEEADTAFDYFLSQVDAEEEE